MARSFVWPSIINISLGINKWWMNQTPNKRHACMANGALTASKEYHQMADHLQREPNYTTNGLSPWLSEWTIALINHTIPKPSFKKVSGPEGPQVLQGALVKAWLSILRDGISSLFLKPAIIILLQSLRTWYEREQLQRSVGLFAIFSEHGGRVQPNCFTVIR